ncbi:hypothetical protein [Hymenobacter negativus]|uniref:Uncharacterized protein n=1 Tax=Hymenobacter negativus TaxID=2795026 RepID=A0ABS0Q8G5_9BACT|nr:hypothetical protein [Hymenobacter negativus]MBH8558973.1 hypothetical protein [Hymenobacter negativus]
MLPSIETIEQLIESRDGRGYEAHYAANKVARLRQLFAAERAHYDAIVQASDEQVIEVTIRTRLQTVVVPVSEATGQQVAMELWEAQGKRLHSLEVEILSALLEQHDEESRGESTCSRARILALCLPQPETVPVAVPAQSTPTPPRLRAARAHRDADVPA